MAANVPVGSAEPERRDCYRGRRTTETGRRPRRAAGAGLRAVVGGDVPSGAADQHRGLHRVLGPRQIGGRCQFVGDRDPRRLELAAARIVRPRQSSSAARPAQPMATSTWPLRHARPKESVIRTAGATSRRSRSPARSRRAESSGSTGSRITVSSSGALEASTPALAHTKPWWVTLMRTPLWRAGPRRSRPGPPEHGADPCRARGPASERVTHDDLREPPRAALGLGDELVGHDEHVGVLGRAGRHGGGDELGDVVAGAELGQAVQRHSGDGRAHRAGVRLGCARAAAASRGCVPRRRACRPASSRRPGGPPECRGPTPGSGPGRCER